MRRMILTTLVLLPVMAQAQASTATEPKPSTSSANLRAELTGESAIAGATPATAIPAASIMPTHPAFREIVHTRMTDDFADAALRQGGTLQYVMYGGGTPSDSSAPSLTRAVEVDLSQQELAAQPAVTNVVVRATVDAYGFPRNLAVAQSGGASLDKKALAAVSQFRFKPAMLDNRPVDAGVLITIRIQKP
jgi:TonB family protein